MTPLFPILWDCGIAASVLDPKKGLVWFVELGLGLSNVLSGMDIFRTGRFALSFRGGTGLRDMTPTPDDEPRGSTLAPGPGSEALLESLEEGLLVPFPKMLAISEYLRRVFGLGVCMTVSEDSCVVISGRA